MVFAVNLILYYARQAFLMILREITLCVLDPPYGYLRTSISSRVFKITFQRNRRFRGGSRIFFRRGCNRLLLYFNTNKSHSFFLQNTSCIRKPQVISGGGGGVYPPAPSHSIRPCACRLRIVFEWYRYR